MSQPFFEWRDAPKAEFAVLGDPISHTLSPAMHTASLRALGRGERYVAIRVPIDEFGPALDRLSGLGYRGLNVTVPLKETAAGWCESLDETAAHLRAVNTIDVRAKHGRNTDAPGFKATLADLEFPSACRSLVLGAGGAARAVVATLAELGHDVFVWNRTPERAIDLLRSLSVPGTIVAAPDPIDAGFIVNCVSGVAGAEISLEWERANTGAVAYDLMVAQRPTPFLEQAARFGLRAIDGKAMLVKQGALSMRGWLAIEPDESAMMKAVVEHT